MMSTIARWATSIVLSVMASMKVSWRGTRPAYTVARWRRTPQQRHREVCPKCAREAAGYSRIQPHSTRHRMKKTGRKHKEFGTIQDRYIPVTWVT